jgi:geranylgeranyl reductase family protein
MTQRVFDVAVVGAGPAAPTAAYYCARNGLAAVLVEKASLPRRKVCGGGLSNKAVSVVPFPVEPAREQQTLSGWVAFGIGRALEVEIARPGIMVCRETFDAYLAEQAVAAGATLVERFDLRTVEQNGGAVTLVSTHGQRIQVRTLVGADGVHSVVRRQCFPQAHPRTVAALEARVIPAAWAAERLRNRCLFDFGAVEAGYGWIFPKRDHFNVGVYRFRKTHGTRDLQAVLAGFLAGNPFLREAEVLDIAGALIPVSPCPGSLVRGQVVLAGDAAGVGDPLYGEGIYYALKSGLEAAGAVVDHLAGTRPLAAFDDRMRALRRELSAAALMAALVYRFPRFTFERIVRSPYACGLFSGVIAGEVSPSRCLFKAVTSSPYWLLAGRTQAGPLPVI